LQSHWGWAVAEAPAASSTGPVPAGPLLLLASAVPWSACLRGRMALAEAVCISTAVLHAVQSALSQQDVLESVSQGQDYLIAFRLRM